eukprot:Clim_evm19s8 gene=Clim_evmTU19s8
MALRTTDISIKQPVGAVPYTPAERICLTANGYLQRIFSSYYNCPVQVEIVEGERMSDNMWRRVVVLSAGGIVLCRATSFVKIRDEKHLHNETAELLDSGAIGIAQLYQRLEIQPRFKLIDHGHYLRDKQQQMNNYPNHNGDSGTESNGSGSPITMNVRSGTNDNEIDPIDKQSKAAIPRNGVTNGKFEGARQSSIDMISTLPHRHEYGLWRDYELSSDVLHCEIREEFMRDVFDHNVEDLQRAALRRTDELQRNQTVGSQGQS